jgi:hypothetical protein
VIKFRLWSSGTRRHVASRVGYQHFADDIQVLWDMTLHH